MTPSSYLLAWFEAATAWNAAAATIAIRSFRIQQRILSGSFAPDPEDTRMVAEKMEAAYAGAVAAATETGRMALRASAGGLKGDEAGRIAGAALRPGYKKARANARRLRRKRG